MVVGEWIPFGANLIANLNEKLGAVSRVKTGLFTTLVDEMPDQTCFRQATTSIGSKVTVVAHEQSTFCNFVADVRFEEEEDIIQVRNCTPTSHVWSANPNLVFNYRSEPYPQPWP